MIESEQTVNENQNEDNNTVDEEDSGEEVYNETNVTEDPAEDDNFQFELSQDQQEEVEAKEEENKIIVKFDLPQEQNSSQNDDTREEISYQEAFVNELQCQNLSEIDSWISSIRTTLLSFPKLMRAKAKKQINDLVSDFEIKYLESLDRRSELE